MVNPGVLLLIYALATLRVTGLITADKITSKVRARAVAALLPDTGVTVARWRWYLGTLITCAWCASIYVSLAAAIVWYTVGDWPPVLVVAVALAFSQVVGMLSDVGR